MMFFFYEKISSGFFWPIFWPIFWRCQNFDWFSFYLFLF